MVWGGLTIVYSIVLNDPAAYGSIYSGIPFPLGFVTGVTQVIFAAFGIWGAARMAKVPLILFDIFMIIVLLMNVASLVVYLVVLVAVTNPEEYVFYILSIAFSIALLILGLVLTKYSRKAC
jgi:hypothetical protein